jgi:hypothetical protein
MKGVVRRVDSRCSPWLPSGQAKDTCSPNTLASRREAHQHLRDLLLL